MTLLFSAMSKKKINCRYSGTCLNGHITYSVTAGGLGPKTAFCTVLADHLSITATVCGPEDNHKIQVPLYTISSFCV